MINILEIGHATGLICCGSLCLATLEEAYQCGVYGNAEPSVIKMSNPTYVRVRELLIQQHGHMEMYGQLPRIHFRAAALEHIRELPDNILYFEQAEPSPSRKVTLLLRPEWDIVIDTYATAQRRLLRVPRFTYTDYLPLTVPIGGQQNVEGTYANIQRTEQPTWRTLPPETPLPAHPAIRRRD